MMFTPFRDEFVIIIFSVGYIHGYLNETLLGFSF